MAFGCQGIGRAVCPQTAVVKFHFPLFSRRAEDSTPYLSNSLSNVQEQVGRPVLKLPQDPFPPSSHLLRSCLSSNAFSPQKPSLQTNRPISRMSSSLSHNLFLRLGSEIKQKGAFCWKHYDRQTKHSADALPPIR